MVVKKKYIPVQIMTAFSDNIDYISPWGTKYIARREVEGNIFVPMGATIINVARKHNQQLFCYIKHETKFKKGFENISP